MTSSITTFIDEDDHDFDKEPLEQLRLEIRKNDVTKTVPALHVGWIENVKYIHYQSPQTTDHEDWLERIAFLQNDLNWFLQLPHHRFWSQIIYDPKSRHCLDSFLTHAPRYYDPPNVSMTDDMITALAKISRSIFLIYLRMATYKESKSCHITPSVFGELIYDNFLFDIPKIMDLCVLYYHGNIALLKKMTSNIFKCQPRYLEDLTSTVPSILNALENVQINLGLEISQAAAAASEEHRNHISDLSMQQFQDLFHFLVDICATLCAFLEVCELGCNVFHKQGFAVRIAAFYELVLPAMQSELKTRLDKKEKGSEILEPRLSFIKTSCIKIFRNIVVNCCLRPLLESSGDEEKQAEFIDDFLEIMIAVLSETHFIRHYAKKYPIEEDLDIMTQTSVILDSTRIEYLVQGLQLILRNPQLENEQESVIESITQNDSDLYFNNVSDATNNWEGACKSDAPTGAELESLITQIKDLLPHLGDGFIEACLNYYNFNTEDVIHALLEENLPTQLIKLDRNMSRITRTDEDASTSESRSNYISSRKNIYDNDEFDVFSRDDVNVSNVLTGKKHERINAKKFLEDKSHLIETKRFFDNHSLVVEVTDSQNDEYDDEYDDTYDEQAVGASEPDQSSDILLERRPFTTPRVLDSRKAERVIDYNDETNDETTEERKRDYFVANPEDIRKANEQRRLQNMEWRRSKNKDYGGNRHDVKGAARGTGQTKEVLHNRAFKERQKSSRANHNRKTGSDRKRSGGMFS